MPKKQIVILLGMCMIALCLGMISCGGGDSESAESTSSSSGNAQSAEDHSSTKKSGGDKYRHPDKPGDVVLAFLSEVQKGQAKTAFDRYVLDGARQYIEYKADGQFSPENIARISKAKFQVESEDYFEETGCRVKVRMIDPEEGDMGTERWPMHKTNGQWMINMADM
jgi:hypothetical protein